MARTRRRAVVVVREGPAGERGWLGLRTALALSLAGDQVTVHLCGAGVGWAAAGLDARAWLEGDAGADLDGLVDDAGVSVVAETEALRGHGLEAGHLRPGIDAADRHELLAGLRQAALVAVF